MRVIDRFFLFLFSVSFVVLALFAFLIGIGFFNEIMLYDMTEQLYTNSDLKLSLIIISITIILLGLYFIIRSLQTKHVSLFSNKRSEIGEIRISMDTIETLASKVTAKTKGVKEQKVKVRLEENETVTIIIKLFVDGETPIPKISEEIQLNVKETVQEIAGIDVGNVHIVVANIGQSNTKKARVE